MFRARWAARQARARGATWIVVLWLVQAQPVRGAEWHVSAGGSGDGSVSAPLGRIQDALRAAHPGDTIVIAPGTYAESLSTVRSGRADAPILLRASEPRAVLVTARGRVLTVRHPHIVVDGLVLDGQYGPSDLVRVESAADGFSLRRSEVRRTARDAIDLAAPRDVLIEESLIHHALNAAGGRTDAHGIVAGGVRRLTIRKTEIHTFSGDAFQVDPGRSIDGWGEVLIEGCVFWLAPLPAAENGFAAGTVPGENAIDTKANGAAARARLTVRDTVAYGFRHGLISNMAAFNLKEHVDVLIDRVTVFDSEIGFRMRGPRANGGARVRVQNAIVHSADVAFRYEDDLESPQIYNVTVGAAVRRAFVAASSGRTRLRIANLLLLGRTLPRQARGHSNLAVDSEAFVNSKAHDYRLTDGSPAVDAGVLVDGVTHDRDGLSRPQGATHDTGAYEWERSGWRRGQKKNLLRRSSAKEADSTAGVETYGCRG